MGILFSEVKYYVSEHRDFSDDTVNGGKPGAEIVNDTIHSIFPEISATERESGFTRYSKIFIFNKSTTRVMKDCIFYIKQDVLPPDRIRLFESSENSSISFDNKNEILGTGSAVAAGTAVEINNILPDTFSASDLVGRKVIIGSTPLTIASSPDGTHISFAENIDIDIVAGYKISTSDDFDKYQNHQNFISDKGYINSLLKSTLTTGATEIFIPMVDKIKFEASDTIVIVDGYHRAVYRGEIDSIANHGTDPEIAIVTLVKPYTSSVTIPSNEGYVSNGMKHTLKPGEGKSFWLELIVSPSDAIDAEVINQFQIGTHFDDITAQ